jgi:hypothetical protein
MEKTEKTLIFGSELLAERRRIVDVNTWPRRSVSATLSGGDRGDARNWRSGSTQKPVAGMKQVGIDPAADPIKRFSG